MMLLPDPIALAVCREFMAAGRGQRFLFGATHYAASIASVVLVHAVIDDCSMAASHAGVPIIRTVDAPADALVVATILGRPRTAAKHLQAAGLRHCDYFTFHRYCGVDLPFARFWSGFGDAAREHAAELAKARQLITEQASLDVFDSIVSFRLSANTAHLRGFSERQDEQYFEDFLELAREGESFIDAGGFDGATTAEFMERCPGFRRVDVFEPDPANMALMERRFSHDAKVVRHAVGLADYTGAAPFASSGSTSSIADEGSVEVRVQRLDDFEFDEITLLKVDIESGTMAALRGARETIRRCHPRLAICVYHEPCDLWQVPLEVASIRNDYDVRLRHYTEGVTETVMFFLPKR